jgi:hypothetical protein
LTQCGSERIRRLFSLKSSYDGSLPITKKVEVPVTPYKLIIDAMVNHVDYVLVIVIPYGFMGTSKSESFNL